jgi:hypothetical protein
MRGPGEVILRVLETFVWLAGRVCGMWAVFIWSFVEMLVEEFGVVCWVSWST